MAYTSLDRLVTRYGEGTLLSLTDRAQPPVGAIDVALVEQELANTDATIDASLGVRYRLPLATVPPLVADIALAIAIYKLHVFAPDPKIERDHDQALRDLRDLAAGTKRLDVAGIEPASSGASGVITSDRPRDMTPDNLRGFI